MTQSFKYSINTSFERGTSLVAQMVNKVSACNVGDQGLIPVSGRSLGEGNVNPLQFSCLENSMDRRAWSYSPWGCKSPTRLSDYTTTIPILQIRK